MKFRVVRVRMKDETFQPFITILEQETFTTADISNMHPIQSGIETSFRELKHTVVLTSLNLFKKCRASITKFLQEWSCMTSVKSSPYT